MTATISPGTIKATDPTRISVTTSSDVTAKIRQRCFNAVIAALILTGRNGASMSWTTTGTVTADTKKYASNSEITIAANSTTPKAIIWVGDKSKLKSLSETFSNASTANGAYPK